MTTRQSPRAARKAYKVTVSLFQWQWDELQMWSILRGITGGEVVSAILCNWLQQNKPPAEEAPPEESPEDA